MPKITRSIGEAIQIGNEILIKIERFGRGEVVLDIQSPDDIPVARVNRNGLVKHLRRLDAAVKLQGESR